MKTIKNILLNNKNQINNNNLKRLKIILKFQLIIMNKKLNKKFQNKIMKYRILSLVIVFPQKINRKLNKRFNKKLNKMFSRKSNKMLNKKLNKMLNKKLNKKLNKIKMKI